MIGKPSALSTVPTVEQRPKERQAKQGEDGAESEVGMDCAKEAVRFDDGLQIGNDQRQPKEHKRCTEGQGRNRNRNRQRFEGNSHLKAGSPTGVAEDTTPDKRSEANPGKSIDLFVLPKLRDTSVDIPRNPFVPRGSEFPVSVSSSFRGVRAGFRRVAGPDTWPSRRVEVNPLMTWYKGMMNGARRDRL
jgi:hypothetical protein